MCLYGDPGVPATGVFGDLEAHAGTHCSAYIWCPSDFWYHWCPIHACAAPKTNAVSVPNVLWCSRCLSCLRCVWCRGAQGVPNVHGACLTTAALVPVLPKGPGSCGAYCTSGACGALGALGVCGAMYLWCLDVLGVDESLCTAIDSY